MLGTDRSVEPIVSGNVHVWFQKAVGEDCSRGEKELNFTLAVGYSLLTRLHAAQMKTYSCSEGGFA